MLLQRANGIDRQTDTVPLLRTCSEYYAGSANKIVVRCHTHPFLSGTTQVSQYQKGNTNLQQETVSGSGISWAIRKSAPRSRQKTMPAPHHSVFLQTGCPSCRPTNSVKALKALYSLGVTLLGVYTVYFWCRNDYY